MMSPRQHLEAAERLLREWEHRRRDLQSWDRRFPGTTPQKSEHDQLNALLDAADRHIRLADRHHLYCPKTKKEGES